jgi:arginase
VIPHLVQRGYAVIEAPSILGLKLTGVDRLPQVLLGNRLGERVDARYAGRVETLPYSHDRDEETGTLNARAIADWSPRLADAIGRVLDSAEFPLVLGGDCSILLGAMLALKRRGRFGLLFIDGHADFYQPAANPNGEAASMDLAFATGYGPALLTDLEQRGPLVRPTDTVSFGFRDADERQSIPGNQHPGARLDNGQADGCRAGRARRPRPIDAAGDRRLLHPSGRRLPR